MKALREKLLSSTSSKPNECVVVAAACCYHSIHRDVIFGCKGDNEVLIFKSRCCLAAKTSPMDVALSCTPGNLKNCGGSFCKLSLYALEMELKSPTVLIRGHNAAFCCRHALALPLSEPVNKPVCAVCCLRLAPQPIGFFAPPTSGSPAPLSAVMQR